MTHLVSRPSAVVRAAAALVVAVAAIAVVGVVRDAGAQSTPTPAAAAPRLITVNGSSERPLMSDASDAARKVAYRDALAAALDDAKDNAQFVADRTGTTLGPIQSVIEQSAGAGSCGVYAFDKGSASAPSVAPAAPRPTKPARHRRTKPRKPAAASVAGANGAAGDNEPYSCPVGAAVTISYAIG
jgi:uncharacterized protein YggE